MGQLYTIGHSTYPIEHFLELLKKYEVQYILDVRSTPFSRYAFQYNADVLEKYLKDHDIHYSKMGKYFGARQPDLSLYHKDGYLDFDKVRDSDLFKAGRDNVIKGLNDFNIALMCTEKYPVDCHRTIMVARGFELAGIDVKHILHNGDLYTQKEVNNELLDKYFPERMQLSLFANENKSDTELLMEAYQIRNSEIGYRLNSDSEGGKI